MATGGSDNIRASSARFLSQSIAGSTSASQDQADALGASLEGAIHEASSSSTGNEYRQEVRSKGLALKKDNPELARDLVEGNVRPEELAGMSNDELKSDRLRESDARIQQQNLAGSIGTTMDNSGGAIPLEGSSEGAALVGSREEDMRLQDNGEYGLGEGFEDAEGEFKARAQPKVGEAMKGIEFDTGDAL